MFISRWACVGFIFAVLLVSEVGATELPLARPEEIGFSAQRLDYIDQFYAEKVKTGEMAGIVTLIARHGKIAHFSAVGYADVGKKQKLQTDAIFRLFSMTKPIASTALMMLYEEGRFQLNDPLSKYIPEFANLRVLRTPDAAPDDTVPLERPPTIQDALRHTVGFAYSGGKSNALNALHKKLNLLGPEVSLAELMSKLATVPLLHQPGTKYVYSISPDVVARLVEVMSDMPFDEFLQNRLFGPLGMKDAGFLVTADKARRLATAHWIKDGKATPLDEVHGYPVGDENLLLQPRFVAYTVEPKRKGGNSGLVATAEDYWRFAQMMLDGGQIDGTRILSPQVVRYMARDHLGSIEIPTQEGRPSGQGFGLGFAVIKDPAAAGFMSSEGTFYWAGAAATHFWIDPKEDMVVVAMTQHLGAPWFSTFWAQIRTMVYSALME